MVSLIWRNIFITNRKKVIYIFDYYLLCTSLKNHRASKLSSVVSCGSYAAIDYLLYTAYKSNIYSCKKIIITSGKRTQRCVNLNINLNV